MPSPLHPNAKPTFKCHLCNEDVPADKGCKECFDPPTAKEMDELHEEAASRYSQVRRGHTVRRRVAR